MTVSTNLSFVDWIGLALHNTVARAQENGATFEEITEAMNGVFTALEIADNAEMHLQVRPIPAPENDSGLQAGAGDYSARILQSAGRNAAFADAIKVAAAVILATEIHEAGHERFVEITTDFMEEVKEHRIAMAAEAAATL